ncbi:hypothetical protein HBI55_182950 [Parastagonospora nodorum]|nr:hypothetical protein HBH47_180610 [Parastagonospora nodorum]KAH5210460.1 hypothetical protein HBI62_207190 [Parastagonospora nodorum]KAH6169640.1 hypothetical protein HBI61_197230 [Parastagonospora nodorum]KAH6487283.1 hypothetical protein HBI55_182950 [Parastagonospora nodorum]
MTTCHDLYFQIGSRRFGPPLGHAPKYRLVVRFTSKDIIAYIFHSEISSDNVFMAAYFLLNTSALRPWSRSIQRSTTPTLPLTPPALTLRQHEGVQGRPALVHWLLFQERGDYSFATRAHLNDNTVSSGTKESKADQRSSTGLSSKNVDIAALMARMVVNHPRHCGRRRQGIAASE